MYKLQELSSLNNKTKKLALGTHVEVIRLWIINHLNEIDYIRMFHHFHNQYLKITYLCLLKYCRNSKEHPKN